ncbi:unnamed protein product [Closterium sp. Yama58-4]|nr:unnamed protein product [Closterium sp. Yama58-4]
MIATSDRRDQALLCFPNPKIFRSPWATFALGAAAGSCAALCAWKLYSVYSADEPQEITYNGDHAGLASLQSAAAEEQEQHHHRQEQQQQQQQPHQEKQLHEQHPKPPEKSPDSDSAPESQHGANSQEPSGEDETRGSGGLDGQDLASLAAADDDIIVEQFTRNIQMFGLPGQLAVHRAFVVVVGLGGVGSHAAAALLRCGVGRLRLVDFDQVSLSSLNRHAVATRADVGISKAQCMREHFLRILPEARVEGMTAMYTEETEEKVLSGQPDYVVDCIDNIDTKVALLSACVRRGLPVISAMGAGARADPTRIRIADISESSIDPLSRAVRQRLRKALGAAAAVEAVFSLDRPKAKLLPVADDSLQPADLQVVPGFRVRVIPVLGTIPAMFGLALATRVVTSLAGMDVGFEPVLRLSADHYSLLHQRLVEREEMRFGSAQEVEVDMDDVMFVVREVWRGRSAWQHLREKEAAEKLLHSQSGKCGADVGSQEEEATTGGEERERGEKEGGTQEQGESEGGTWEQKLGNGQMAEEQGVEEGREEGKKENGTQEQGRSGQQQQQRKKGERRKRAVKAASDRIGIGGGRGGGGIGGGGMDVGRAIWQSMGHMTLTRWNAALPPTIDNLVLFTFDEAEAHEAMSLEQVELEQPELFRLVDSTLERARRLYT